MSLNPAARALSLGVLLLAGCSSLRQNRDTAIGAGTGAVLGGVIGNQVSHGTGTYLGAALGALAGGAVGHYMDRQRHALQRQLAQEQAAQQAAIIALADGSLRVSIAADASFDVDSAELKPQALITYAKVAQVLKDYPKTVIWVIGHTDDTGPADYNQRLSERRAQTVASDLIGQGVPAERIREEGRGEAGPVTDNATAAGRARNRRVDVIIRPIIAGDEATAYRPPQ
ncbi:MAG: OmpA family protein [Gammaproteobacteria bacterium]|nr:OmpA family protein [Gammaproteobacteria bacterium]